MLCDACEPPKFGDMIRPTPAGAWHVGAGAISNRPVKKDRKPTRNEPAARATEVNTEEMRPNTLSNTILNQPPKIIINELMAYVIFYRNNSCEEALQHVVLTSFPPLTITEATKLLVQQYLPLLGSLLQQNDATWQHAVHTK